MRQQRRLPAARLAAASALAQTILRSMLATKLTITALAALAVTVVVSATVVVGAARRGDDKSEINEPAASRPAAVTKDHGVPEPTAETLIDVRGRVMDPDGRPVAGATVRTGYMDREIKPAPEVTSASDGRFFMQVPPWRRNSAHCSRDAMFPWVVASAPGFGPGWASAVRQQGETGEVVIRLVADGPPIEGRIVDLEGRPVAGAQVKAERVWFASSTEKAIP